MNALSNTSHTTVNYAGNSTYSHHDNGTDTVQRNKDLAKVEIAVQSVIFGLAVVGNVIVLLVLMRVGKRQLSRMYIMVAHLATADLFVAFFNVLPQLLWDVYGKFYGGDVICRLVTYLQVVAMYASSYVLVSTAIDRYIAICYPLLSRAWTTTRVHILVGTAWGFSVTFSLPQLAIFAYREYDNGKFDCYSVFSPGWTLQVYVVWTTLAVYIVPFLILAVTYGRICHTVQNSSIQREMHLSASHDRSSGRVKQSKDRSSHFSNNHVTNGAVARQTRRGDFRVSRFQLRTVKLTLAVIVCYLVCWGPFFLTQMWSAFDPKAPSEDPFMVIFFLLASLNSCTNPWIYLFFVTGIRGKLRRCQHKN